MRSLSIRMEEVLQVYQRPYDPQYPVLCLDEASKQLIGEVIASESTESGNPARVHHEYERKGTENLFMICEPKHGWRRVELTEHRCQRDWALCVRDLVDVQYPPGQEAGLD